MEWMSIGETFTFVRNGKNIKQFGEEGYPITRIETIADRYVDETRVGYAAINDLEGYEDYILQKGDILMSHINSVKHLAKTAIFDSESILIHGMNLLCLRADKNIIHPYYGFYYLNSAIFLNQIPQIIKNSINQASFNITDLKELEIPVPPMAIQKQIVEVLDEAQKLIDNRKKQIELLDDLIESIFYDMFGDPVKNDKGWEVKKLVNVSRINMGQSPPSSSYNNENIGLPFYQGNADFGYKYPNIEKYCSEPKKIANPNDILMSVRAPIGALNIANKKCCIGRGLCSITVFKSNSREYVYMYLKNIRELLKSEGTGSTFKAISKRNLENIDINIPPLPLQNQFAEKVQAIEKQKELLRDSLKLMEDNYNSLMQRAFKGELF